MKKSNLLEGILFILGGIILLYVALLTDTVLDSLLIGFAAGAISSGIVMTCKYFYWSTPKNKERYQEKIENEKIELHDELKTKLRDRSGRYAYTIGLMTVSISIAIFSILGSLEIIDNSRLIVLYLGGYLVFQIVIGIVIFNQLLKKYE
ncbi:MAG TPA: hypothetical protein H9717_07540 [Candidatus Eisenbergiella merdipullorum]|uniref:Uncharacterized protein n=1 Tax=Candidatus Eisenbergiella merdipullorum TaxID=2838553 RepID=A0A9D2L146_9FIRM|nr:hypothetical protein [Candidatus Eisenbergiella merdipullorum]